MRHTVHDPSFSSRPPGMLVVLCAIASLVLGACEKPVEPKLRPAIQVEAGYKYYVGGPIMRVDEYGRTRLGGFSGLVLQPTNRGLLVGVRTDAEGTFEFSTWLNGALAQSSTGFIREDGTYWFYERQGYNSKGAAVTKRTFLYNDDRQVVTTTVVYYDASDGSVLEERSWETPYTPPPNLLTEKQEQRRAERREKRADKRDSVETKQGTP